MNSKTLAKKTAHLLWEVYGPFFPTGTKKREKFLELVREKVAFYTPMIEGKTGVKLGEVKVKDHNQWLSDYLYGEAPVRIVQTSWEHGRVPDELDYTLGFFGAGLMEALVTPPLFLYNTISGIELRHHNSTIYAPFNYMNKFGDIDFKIRSKRLDYCVAHELGHTLWEKIYNKGLFEDDPIRSRESREWHEGFATYCAEEYFREFYPPGIATKYELKRVYRDGLEKVESAVKRHGEEIFLKIPKKWKELEKEEKHERWVA